MNWGLLIVFIVVQLIVNNFVGPLFFTMIPGNSIFESIAFYMLASLIIAFVGALFSTPKGYRKDFYRHPAFHKTMLIYFSFFFIIDLAMLLITIW